jgi:hypothetical protein
MEIIMKISIYIFIVFNCVISFTQEINNESNDKIECHEFLKLSIDSLLLENHMVEWGDERPQILYRIELDDSSHFSKIKIVNIADSLNKKNVMLILYDVDYSCLLSSANIEEIKPIGFFVSYRNGFVGKF